MIEENNIKKELKIEEGKLSYIQRAKDHKQINDAKYRTLAHLESMEQIGFKNLSNTI